MRITNDNACCAHIEKWLFKITTDDGHTDRLTNEVHSYNPLQLTEGGGWFKKEQPEKELPNCCSDDHK